jgi:tetratricopeptide (TPR) repeat protein
LDAGVSPRRLVRSIRQLRAWLTDVPCVGDLLPGLMQDGRRFLFRSGDGSLVETSGQMVFEFPSEAGQATLPWTSGLNSAAMFEEAARLEQEGQLDEAANLYRQLIAEEGSDADLSFNLANVLYAQGLVQAAVERLREAVTLDPLHTDAWHNLGTFLALQGQPQEACYAYRQAVLIEPNYADAHYGLADVLEQLFHIEEACTHWKVYLQYEQEGQWADYARARLAVHSS